MLWYPGLDPGTEKKDISGKKTDETWINSEIYLIVMYSR